MLTWLHRQRCRRASSDGRRLRHRQGRDQPAVQQLVDLGLWSSGCPTPTTAAPTRSRSPPTGDGRLDRSCRSTGAVARRTARRLDRRATVGSFVRDARPATTRPWRPDRQAIQVAVFGRQLAVDRSAGTAAPRRRAGRPGRSAVEMAVTGRRAGTRRRPRRGRAARPRRRRSRRTCGGPSGPRGRTPASSGIGRSWASTVSAAQSSGCGSHGWSCARSEAERRRVAAPRERHPAAVAAGFAGAQDQRVLPELRRVRRPARGRAPRPGRGTPSPGSASIAMRRGPGPAEPDLAAAVAGGVADHVVVGQHPGRRGADRPTRGRASGDHLAERVADQGAVSQWKLNVWLQLVGAHVAGQAPRRRGPGLADRHPVAGERRQDPAPAR